MATYRQHIGTYKIYTLAGIQQCACYIRVETTTDIVKNTTKIDYYLDREGTSLDDEIKFNITINGNKRKYSSRKISGASELHLTDDVINHNEDGTFGTVSIEFEIYANYNNLLYVWLFHESCTFSFSLENIDRSTPDVYLVKTSADRFGKNVSISFWFEQHYDLRLSDLAATEAKLTLKGLDWHQAVSRTASSLNADSSSIDVSGTSDGVSLYNLIAKKTSGLKQNTTYTFTLDSAESQDIAPLTIGKAYEYEIVVTSENGNTGRLTGVLQIPQKVTGLSCESTLNMIIGDTSELEYSIFPANAQEQGTLFESSDTNVAEIDANGVITAKSEGPCIITVTTVDGGFSAYCYVTVLSTAGFPVLNEVINYLTVTYFNKMLFAVDFVKDELISIGASVDDLEEINVTGKNHPVTEIMAAFIAMESNCQKLRSAASAQGIAISSLPSMEQTIQKPNYSWIIVVNTWIAFLNELHSKINGGG